MEQTLILVDHHDTVIGYAPRSECHIGNGHLHRAVAICLFNEDGELLIQRRKSMLWDDCWDVTAATHVLAEDVREESIMDAVRRCLLNEWGLEGQCVIPVGAFTYFARYGPYAEREYCHLLIGRCGSRVVADPCHAYGYKWMPLDDCHKMLSRETASLTPWGKISIAKLVDTPDFGLSYAPVPWQ